MIPLSRGLFAIVDEADAQAVSSHIWSAMKRSVGFYAQTSSRTDKGRRPITLHRFLWNRWGLPETPEIDHENNDGLDCRRENLRAATRAQNAHNMRKPVTNTSGRKGVSWDPVNRKWKARIRVNNKLVDLGRHDDLDAAATAYQDAAARLHGEFARTA